jgi:hypothetical protein
MLVVGCTTRLRLMCLAPSSSGDARLLAYAKK